MITDALQTEASIVEYDVYFSFLELSCICCTVHVQQCHPCLQCNTKKNAKKITDLIF